MTRKLAHACVPVDFLRVQGFGDLVQGPGMPEIRFQCQKIAGRCLGASYRRSTFSRTS